MARLGDRGHGDEDTGTRVGLWGSSYGLAILGAAGSGAGDVLQHRQRVLHSRVWHGDDVIHMQPQGLLTCCANLSKHIPS